MDGWWRRRRRNKEKRKNNPRHARYTLYDFCLGLWRTEVWRSMRREERGFRGKVSEVERGREERREWYFLFYSQIPPHSTDWHVLVSLVSEGFV